MPIDEKSQSACTKYAFYAGKWWYMPLIPVLSRDSGRQIFMNSRLAWSMEWSVAQDSQLLQRNSVSKTRQTSKHKRILQHIITLSPPAAQEDIPHVDNVMRGKMRKDQARWGPTP
jgi:hypothetical protein